MHYHLEVIIPPTDDIEDSVHQVMKPFKDESVDEDLVPNRHTWWDFYVIGGRFSGQKLIANFEQDRITKFYDDLKALKIKVNGFQAGKQELSHPSYIPIVDELWNKSFPESPIKICPFFKHFNDQYKDSPSFPDVLSLKEVPEGLKASAVLIAKKHYDDPNLLEAGYLIHDSLWNGVTHVDSKWDGNVLSILATYKETMLKVYKEAYLTQNMPTEHWRAVTVDYHS